MNDINNLKKELDTKIHNLFHDNQAYLEYLLQTKNNFIYRYLESTSDKNIQIKNFDSKTLIAESYESNMGEAFKITDKDIKDGIKNLAKSVPRDQNPCVKYSLKTVLEEFLINDGKIIIEASVDWGFPTFSQDDNHFKKKTVTFTYNDPNIFRKELALKYEEACEIFG